MLSALGIAFLVVGLMVSIALHELGHLVPAKRFGVKVTFVDGADLDHKNGDHSASFAFFRSRYSKLLWI